MMAQKLPNKTRYAAVPPSGYASCSKLETCWLFVVAAYSPVSSCGLAWFWISLSLHFASYETVSVFFPV